MGSQGRSVRGALSILPLLFLLGAAACSPGARTTPRATPPYSEILWDTWGVPHIFASDTVQLFYAYGWAQMASHGDLLLRSYGKARGRAAEYWGPGYLDEDRWLVTNDVPGRARRWYEAQSPSMRLCLDAFAAGINAYGREHGDGVGADVRPVLPVSAVDVLAHVQSTIQFAFLANPLTIRNEIGQSLAAPQVAPSGGSMAWAVAPRHTRSGHSLLLINPHVEWDGPVIWYESQLNAPGVDITGATVVGFPILAVGFNDHLGWAHTVNPMDGYDLYQLDLRPGGYAWEGGSRAFEQETLTLKVRQLDGSLKDEPLQILRSIQGPVIWQGGGHAVALRVAGLDTPGIVEQYWDMARARDLQEFEGVLRRLQSPMFSVIYADDQGHILHLFGGRIPIRNQGDWKFWAGLIPGDNASTLWTKIHPYEDLPRVLDPPTGWLQNANDPPWLTTFPPILDPTRFPPYMAPRSMELRAQNAITLLRANPHISFEDLVAYKHSTHCELADRWLGDLLPAARTSGDPDARQAAEVLASWDRTLEANSRGAVLFEVWAMEVRRRRPLTRPTNFATVWRESEPLTTPTGIVNPVEAAQILADAAREVRKAFGRLDVPFGEANRLRIGNVDLPGNGGPSFMGSLRTLYYELAKDGRFEARAGETYVAVVELSHPLRAAEVLSYGNASQPGSRHRSDQLALLSQKRLRPVWRSRGEIERHLESRVTLSYPVPTTVSDQR
jgi:acyl-homoserine-lactone acylase